MNNTYKRIFTIILFIIFILIGPVLPQPNQIKNSAELQLALQKLNVLGSVLYIGAHPDDENTNLMAYWSKGKKYRAAYLSLTRGDGGQNLVGSEKGNEIGILRTQELLQARSIDGGEQYFTRAIDFGFSKSPEESLDIWGKENILADVVWVIRKFKPDIIVTRFQPGGNGGHGHHTASAALAREAFLAAADPKQFPEQLKYVQPWQTKRIFWNNFRPTQDEIKNSITVDVGEYNELLGKSYTELAAESRSMHKSQGFGVSAFRGSRMENFTYVNGEKATKDIFDGINTSWDRINNCTTVGKEVYDLIKNFNPQEPSASLNKLVDLYFELNSRKTDYWIEVKKQELLNIIQSCAGLWMEAMASDYSAAPGDAINIVTTLVNRTDKNIRIEKVEFPTIPVDTVINNNLASNQPFSVNTKITIPNSYPISQPYWLSNNSTKGLFTVTDQQLIGAAENSFPIPVRISISYNGKILDFAIPLLYRWNDRVDGEKFRPFEIRPPVTANPNQYISVFQNGEVKEVQLKLKSSSPDVSGEIHLHANADWNISPSVIPFSIKNKYGEQIIKFIVTPPKNTSVANLKIELNVKGNVYNKSMIEISYPHIKPQVYFPESEIKLIKLELKKFDTKIGYVMGSGDEIPDCLRDVGYDVTLLNDESLDGADLSNYDAIITGIRAYNTRERLKYDQPRLLEYVKNGGTLIVQYNVPSGLQTENIGPYSFKLSNDRITVEESPINFVNPGHQLLNFPNKVTQNDFDNWVQERGLYFSNQWDEKYTTVLAGHDPGEKDLPGGMLFANYGKGVFIYSGYAWFRQLPAGISGAYKIFVNMISAGKYNEQSSK